MAAGPAVGNDPIRALLRTTFMYYKIVTKMFDHPLKCAKAVFDETMASAVATTWRPRVRVHVCTRVCAQIVEWDSGDSLSQIVGRQIRLRIDVPSGCRLYAFWFCGTRTCTDR